MECTLIVTYIFIYLFFKLTLEVGISQKVCEGIKIMIKEVGILKYGWCIDGWGYGHETLFLCIHVM
jgi:hypothetical protein